ncbi:GUN4 domain-containing protein [Leptolyngbya sp. CCY15150]|uniref:GUN4 domain-containing protein n=1 Tax=Leptolyngbya sp. CCY15150 TaxID=2767772 RepID=UPI00194EBEA2|nr:GUN4 domain-containing protein [Leptolyngbya sp. CCY15150]
MIVGVAITRAIDGAWGQAIQALGVAAGAWVLIKVGVRLAPKVERVVDHVDRTFDNRVELTLSTVTGFHRQYLEALKTHCHSINIEGYKGRLPRLVLEKVYVPLRVSVDDPDRSPLQNRSLKIWDKLPKVEQPDGYFSERLIAIIASPGYGKTTLLRFLTLSFSNTTYIEHGAKDLIPVLLLFRSFHSAIQSKKEPSLPTLIVSQVKELPRCDELRTSEPWFKGQLSRGKCLVMFDGLDEVPEERRDLVSQWANWQMQNYQTQFIITSRPHGYDNSLFSGVQRFDVLDLNSDQQRLFIEQWYSCITWEREWKSHYEESQQDPNSSKRLSQEQAAAESEHLAQLAADDLKRQLFSDRSLTDLAKNPLLITIIAATHEAGEQLPKQRIHLYREIFKVLLEYRPNRRDTRLTITNADDNQKVLQGLALSLTEAKKTRFSAEEGADWIRDRLTTVHPAATLTPKGFLDEIQKISGLLAGGEGNLYEFTHKTFQEYLAALELSSITDGFSRVISQLESEDWKEVIYFFAMQKDPNPFIEAALKSPNVSHLALAWRLVKDNPRVREDLKDKTLDALREHNFIFSSMQLYQRFRNLVQINDKAGVSEFITWGEYKLLQQDQLDGQFHSQSAIYSTYHLPSGNPIEDISWEDARWFCAWLSTQASLASEDEVYDYRLPTPEEWQQVQQHIASSEHSRSLTSWTTDPALGGNALCVVRERIPDCYRNLVNYLANGAWKEADQETERQMLKAVGSDAEKRGCLDLEEIREFPCDDLRIIDRLWVKFSGGRFGFSVQKQIWVEVGGKLDYSKDLEAAVKAYGKMSDRNGWQQSGSFISPSDVIFDITAPLGHLPSFGMLGLVFEGAIRLGVVGGGIFLSRIQTCKL